MTDTDAKLLELGAARYRIVGMDCSSCAEKIERAVRAVAGIEDVRVSIASGEMALSASNPASQLPEVERTVAELGYRLTRLDMANDDDERIPNLPHVTPDYRRALLIVVLLNIGYGLVEIAGGFLAGSQALKADALDFVGDGIISWLGLIAMGWSLAARAKAALTQGVFLGLLGLAVLIGTIYRVLVLHAPQAELMGVFGAAALVVNVLAAMVLIPHRKGDANVRAVWLFSRNDAIGNVAVVIAAGLVAWTGTAWPDLITAMVIAGLFMQSSWSIVRDARKDMTQAAVQV